MWPMRQLQEGDVFALRLKAVEAVMQLTANRGVDVAIEAVGTRTTFDICQAIVAAGGTIANIGVHGESVNLHLEKLWDRNISLTTRLVDTVSTPFLLKTMVSGRLRRLITPPLQVGSDRAGLQHVRQRRPGARVEGHHQQRLGCTRTTAGS
jgi:threonine dehydrogenase-like Zn-dependent dehydrogenase